jgi:hypothetical protein
MSLALFAAGPVRPRRRSRLGAAACPVLILYRWPTQGGRHLRHLIKEFLGNVSRYPVLSQPCGLVRSRDRRGREGAGRS